jgi:hypothetical protein
MITPIDSECTYRVCVSSSFWWQDSEKCVRLAGFWCLSWLCTLSNSNYRLVVQVGLLRMELLTGQWRFCKWKATDISRFKHKTYRKGIFVYDTDYDMIPENTVDKGHNGPFCWLSTDSNCIFCSFVCSFIWLSFVCLLLYYCITVLFSISLNV